jgi:hypothetical protein
MSPRNPFRRTWLRYMPVMPASPSTAISTFRELRTASSVVVTEVASTWGWLIWTPMKISPATTAAAPAARVRVVGVMVMSGSLFRWSVAGAAGCPERMARCGDRASPHVVTDDVTVPATARHVTDR